MTFPVTFFGIAYLVLNRPYGANTPVGHFLQNTLNIKTPFGAGVGLVVMLVVQVVIEMTNAFKTRAPEHVLHPILRGLISQIWHNVHMALSIVCAAKILLPYVIFRIVISAICNASFEAPSMTAKMAYRGYALTANDRRFPTDSGFSASTDVRQRIPT